MDPVTVGGMVISAFLQVLFDRVASRAVLDFFKDKKLDDGLLRKLKLKLLAVNKLLDDAEEKQISDKRVKKWLQDLQDAVDDAEDLLDAVNTEAMRRQLEKEWQPKKSKSKLKLKICCSRFLERKDATSSSGHSDSEMETQLKVILERLEDIVGQKDILGLKEGVGEKPYKKLPTTSLVDEHAVYGRDGDKESILKLLLAENSYNDPLGVIAIKGMGGIGKTTLAQLVYNDDRVDKHFDFKAWVCISEEFDVFKVTRIILEAVSSSTTVTNNPDILQVELKNKLMDKRFLLVLDDVWNEDWNQWEMLKKPLQHGAKGSKIIVTTRNEGVAKIMQTVPTYNLMQMSEKDCWTLLAKYAFEGGESQAHSIFEEVGKEIVKKCEGLPLAAKALGGLLRCKTTTEEWIKVKESNVWELKDADCNILPVLQVSYRYLPSHLKRCFAFSCVFPKDYGFEKEQLILYWTALSLLPEKDGGEKMHSIGEEYFNELVSRSFFERSSAQSSFFVMHDLMHDLAILVSGQSCHSMDRDGLREIPEMTRHVSYFRMSLKQLEALPMTNRLRTFIPVESGGRAYYMPIWHLYHEEVPDDLLMRFNFLRVLSLRDYEIYELPESIGNLKYLRYFDLSKTSIERLPDSICDLYNLQFLILAICRKLVELPTNMWKLVNLLYLDITACDRLKQMPGNLCKLKNLVRLSTFVVGKDSTAANIRDLGPLNLHRTLSIFSLQNVTSPADVTEARLKDKCIEKMKLSWNSDQDGRREEYDVLEKLQPHKSLKELSIESYGDARLPNWIGSQLYTNMASLNLENCKYCISITLGKLPSLKKLVISGFDRLQEWLHCNDNSFPHLDYLCLQQCPELKNLPSHLPSLTALEIEKCPELAASLAKAPALSYLCLEKTDKMLLYDLPQRLAYLRIHDCDGLESLPERLMQINSCLQSIDLSFCPSLKTLPRVIFTSTLKYIKLYICDSLELPMDQEYPSLESLIIEESCQSLQSLPLQFFPKLSQCGMKRCKNLESLSLPDGTSHEFPCFTHLDISDCPEFLAFPDKGLSLPNLNEFLFVGNEKAKALPKQMPSFQFLQTLIVHKCPEIESLPEGGLPLSLSVLTISGSDKFVAKLLDWGLHRLSALKELSIAGKCQGVVSFPAEGLLPKNLNVLEIHEFSDLERLERKGFQQLISLTEFKVADCPKLKCIPPEVLPASLTLLDIDNCPLLEKLEYNMFQHLTSLAKLKIKLLPKLKRIPPEGLSASLNDLVIEMCHMLEALEHEGFQHLTSLTKLSILSCSKFKSIPKEGLPASLTQLFIEHCPLLKRRLQREGGEDWDKISHIPCVFINGRAVLS